MSSATVTDDMNFMQVPSPRSSCHL